MYNTYQRYCQVKRKKTSPNPIEAAIEVYQVKLMNIERKLEPVNALIAERERIKKIIAELKKDLKHLPSDKPYKGMTAPTAVIVHLTKVGKGMTTSGRIAPQRG